MRGALKKLEGQRQVFTGVFVRYGIKKNWHGFPETTILLKDIKNSTDKIVTDHIWFNLTKGFQKLGTLSEGELIQFQARVRPYVKGYAPDFDCELDYKLNNPSMVLRLQQDLQQIAPEDRPVI